LCVLPFLRVTHSANQRNKQIKKKNRTYQKHDENKNEKKKQKKKQIWMSSKINAKTMFPPSNVNHAFPNRTCKPHLRLTGRRNKEPVLASADLLVSIVCPHIFPSSIAELVCQEGRSAVADRPSATAHHVADVVRERLE
jgi:hypothetical protein